MSSAAIIRASHEPKNLDQASSYSLSTTTGTLVLLNAILQGSSGVNRTGRQVKLDHLRLNLAFNQTNQVPADFVRYIVLMDRESRGSAPAVGDVLTNTTFGIQAVLSSHNFDNVPSRFKILADEVLISNATVSTSSTNATWNEPWNHRLIHIPLKQTVHYYNTSAGTIADIDSNALYLITWGQNSTNPTELYFDSRLVFRDM
jgi:hypothetical protein